MRGLDLLQHRRLNAFGEDVAGQQQHGQAIDRRHCSARQHVGRAWPDRGGAGEGLQPVLRLGIGDGGQHLGLLVARLMEAQQMRKLLQGLAQPGHIAVAENTPCAGEKGLLQSVAFGVLVHQVQHQRLRRCEPFRVHPLAPLSLSAGCARVPYPCPQSANADPARSSCLSPTRSPGHRCWPTTGPSQPRSSDSRSCSRAR